MFNDGEHSGIVGQISGKL